MKFALNLFLFALLLFGEKALPLTNNKIKKMCKKERDVKTCIKNLQIKRSNLQKGYKIEIPVIPYKR